MFDAASNPLTFSSEVHDSTLGLQYYNYRHLNTLDGRWLSRDPIEEEGGMNIYGFVANDEVNNWDFLGERDLNLLSCSEFNKFRAYVDKLQIKYIESLMENCGTVVDQRFLDTMSGRVDAFTMGGSINISIASVLDNARCNQKSPDVLSKYGSRVLMGGGWKDTMLEPKIYRNAGRTLSVLSIGMSVSSSACAFNRGDTRSGFENIGRGSIAGLGMIAIGVVPGVGTGAAFVLLAEDYYLDRKLDMQIKQIRRSECARAKQMLDLLNGYISDISNRKCCCSTCDLE